MKKFKKSIILIATFLLAILGLSFTPIATTHAATDICSQDVPQEVKDANGCGGGAAADLETVIVNIVSGIVGALGLVAVIFIVVGGINYMTSQGDPSKLKKAKDTILYAAIGLIIAVLAFAIVNFVIRNVINNNAKATSSSETLKGGEAV